MYRIVKAASEGSQQVYEGQRLVEGGEGEYDTGHDNGGEQHGQS